MTILPAAYLPSVEYLAHLVRGGCVIDLGEHFIKRSERNRAQILAANGVLDLTVPVCNANRPQTPVCEVRIDYSKKWQHQHWGALVASYKGSPYFDHYAPHFEPFYKNEYGYRFLAEYDLGLTEVFCRLLGVEMPAVQAVYVEAGPGNLDLRPKSRMLSGEVSSSDVPGFCGLQQKGPAFVAEPYVQVFADRMPFVPNLSFADLLFAEGPAAVSVLKHSLQIF